MCNSCFTVSVGSIFPEGQFFSLTREVFPNWIYDIIHSLYLNKINTLFLEMMFTIHLLSACYS